MRILLDAGRKTVIAPRNCAAKWEEINRMVRASGSPEAKIKAVGGYIGEGRREAMSHSDTQLKTAPRPTKPIK